LFINDAAVQGGTEKRKINPHRRYVLLHQGKLKGYNKQNLLNKLASAVGNPTLIVKRNLRNSKKKMQKMQKIKNTFPSLDAKISFA